MQRSLPSIYNFSILYPLYAGNLFFFWHGGRFGLCKINYTHSIQVIIVFEKEFGLCKINQDIYIYIFLFFFYYTKSRMLYTLSCLSFSIDHMSVNHSISCFQNSSQFFLYSFIIFHCVVYPSFFLSVSYGWAFMLFSSITITK